MDETSGVYKFASVGELSETVTQMLSLGLHARATVGGNSRPQAKRSLERIEQMILQQASDYLSEVREGFTLSVRTKQVTRRSELRFLLERVLFDWQRFEDELGLSNDSDASSLSAQHSSTSSTQSPTPPFEPVRHQLLAFSMAITALGHLPKLPAENVTFPHSYSNPATYHDIPTPDTPGEMLSRIEELEQMIWRLMSMDLQQLLNQQYGALRRTYGFFEASAHLALHEAKRFGIKPQQASISFL